MSGSGRGGGVEEAPLALAEFARLVAAQFHDTADDHVVSLGDWGEPVAEGRRPRFQPTLRVTVGHFRRWAAEA